jgi:hypothetical protein
MQRTGVAIISAKYTKKKEASEVTKAATETNFLSHAPDIRNSIAFWKVPRLLSKCNMQMTMSMKHWWKDTDRDKPKYLERHTGHHKMHMGRLGIEPGSSRLRGRRLTA